MIGIIFSFIYSKFIPHSLGYLDGPKALHESLMAIKRAGADFIFTYAIKQVLERLS